MNTSKKINRESLEKMDLPLGTGSPFQGSARTLNYPSISILQKGNIDKVSGASTEDFGKLYVRGSSNKASDLREAIDATLLQEQPIKFRKGEKGMMNIVPIHTDEYYEKLDQDWNKGIVWLLKLDEKVPYRTEENGEVLIDTVLVIIKGSSFSNYFKVEAQRRDLASQIGIPRKDLKTIYQHVTITSDIAITEPAKNKVYVYEFSLSVNTDKLMKLAIPDFERAESLPAVEGVAAIAGPEPIDVSELGTGEPLPEEPADMSSGY